MKIWKLRAMRLSKISKLSALMMLMVAALAACNTQADSAASAVQSYLTGQAAGDEKKLLSVVCKAQEEQARTDAASFVAVKARIEGLSCQAAGEDAPFSIVSCQGNILLEYAGETRARSLADRNYKAIKEDGRWKMCGYKDK